MIGVTVRDENQIDCIEVGQVLLSVGVRGVRDPGIDQQDVPRRRDQPECGMAVPGEARPRGCGDRSAGKAEADCERGESEPHVASRSAPGERRCSMTKPSPGERLVSGFVRAAWDDPDVPPEPNGIVGPTGKSSATKANPEDRPSSRQ